jgi:hypothetical protein
VINIIRNIHVQNLYIIGSDNLHLLENESLVFIFLHCLIPTFLLLSWVGVHCGIYKSSHNGSNIPYLNSSLLPFFFTSHLHTWNSWNPFSLVWLDLELSTLNRKLTLVIVFKNNEDVIYHTSVYIASLMLCDDSPTYVSELIRTIIRLYK